MQTTPRNLVKQQQIVDLRTSFPTMTLQEIANRMTPPISRERVRQILARVGQPTRHITQYYCRRCGIAVEFAGRLCLVCKGIPHQIWVDCLYCGATIKRSWSQYRRTMEHYSTSPTTQYLGRFFCNRTCFAKFTYSGPRLKVRKAAKGSMVEIIKGIHQSHHGKVVDYVISYISGTRYYAVKCGCTRLVLFPATYITKVKSTEQ